MKKFFMWLLGIPELQLPPEGPFCLWYSNGVIVCLGDGPFKYLGSKRFIQDNGVLYNHYCGLFMELEEAKKWTTERPVEKSREQHYKDCLQYIR